MFGSKPGVGGGSELDQGSSRYSGARFGAASSSGIGSSMDLTAQGPNKFLAQSV